MRAASVISKCTCPFTLRQMKMESRNYPSSKCAEEKSSSPIINCPECDKKSRWDGTQTLFLFFFFLFLAPPTPSAANNNFYFANIPTIPTPGQARDVRLASSRTILLRPRWQLACREWKYPARAWLSSPDYRIIFRTIFFTWLPECIKKIVHPLRGSVLARRFATQQAPPYHRTPEEPPSTNRVPRFFFFCFCFNFRTKCYQCACAVVVKHISPGNKKHQCRDQWITFGSQWIFGFFL